MVGGARWAIGLCTCNCYCQPSFKNIVMAEVREGQGSGDGEPSASGGDQQAGQQPQGQQQTWGQLLKSVMFQMLIIYFITSFFRGRQAPQSGEDVAAVAAVNLFPNDEKMVHLSNTVK